MNDYFMTNFFIMLAFVILIAVMAVLVVWARRRSKGMIVFGALLSFFAPDPTLEQKIVMVEKAKADQTEEDEQDGQ